MGYDGKNKKNSRSLLLASRDAGSIRRADHAAPLPSGLTVLLMGVRHGRILAGRNKHTISSDFTQGFVPTIVAKPQPVRVRRCG